MEEVLKILEKAKTHDYIGESITQWEHALQGAHFAKKAGENSEMIVAVLMHDLGHLLDHKESMGKFGAAQHEHVGADYLIKNGFNEQVAELVRGHVAAKRYLVSTSPEYVKTLSPASQETLKHQGAQMSEKEITAFESHPLKDQWVQLRRYDDMAKLVDYETPDITEFYNDIQSCITETAKT